MALRIFLIKISSIIFCKRTFDIKKNLFDQDFFNNFLWKNLWLVRKPFLSRFLRQFFVKEPIACFIYFMSEISVMVRTEISVNTLHYWNFCTPYYRNFWCKVDETSFWHVKEPFYQDLKIKFLDRTSGEIHDYNNFLI